MTRIGLGTVQFGVPYGITNTAGQVPPREVSAILECARNAGVRTLDTAALYGDSERAIGAAGADGFEIVTKTSKAAGADSAAEAVDRLERTFATSLERLGCSRVHALMAHEADDLLGPYGSALWAAMERIAARGLVSRIGASVYTAAQIDALLDRFPISIVQLPINAVDRRLVEGGQLARLDAAGVEIHARSVFLQGLLLAPVERIPTRFAPLADKVRGLDGAFAERALSRLDGLLAAVLQCREIDRLIVGVTSAGELAEILAAASRAETAIGAPFDLSPFAVTDARILSPALWPMLESASPSADQRQIGNTP